jgi:replicative DNA helicase Mcm
MGIKEAKNQMIKLLSVAPNKNKGMSWDSIKDLLMFSGFPKSTIYDAKNSLVDEEIIKEDKDKKTGKKILILLKEPDEPNLDDFNEERFRMFYEHKIKEYFKHVLYDEECREFDVREFIRHFPDAGELNDELIDHPIKVRKVLTDIFLEVYEFLYGESLDIEFIHIKNPLCCKISISKLSSKYAGKLVEFRGMIIQSSEVKPRVYKARYACPICGATKYIKLGFWDSPEKMGKSLSCPKDSCKCNKGLIHDENASHNVDFQEITVQEPIQDTYDGKQHSITVFYDFYGAEKAIYSGYVKIVGVPIVKMTKKSSVGEVYIYAFNIEKDDDIERKIRNIKDKDLELIKKMVEGKDALKIISEYAFREIKEYEIIKLALLLQMVGSMETETLRSSINILLISDPGVGKSTIMRVLKKRFIFVKYANAITTSGPGLTGAVVREKTEFGDSWILKLGVLPKADVGIACIDELSRNKEIFKYLLEVMEQQRVSISKAGIEADVLARCSILAACNPIHGRFDPEKTVWEQINLPPELLDRFDLIFPIFDVVDEKMDADIVDFLVKSVNSQKKKYEINGIELNDELLLKYILYAKQLKPKISDEAKRLIQRYYVEKRKESKNKGVISISARQAGTIIRMSMAHAKLRLSEIVEEEDVKVAISIIEECLKRIAYDPELETIDVSRISGIPKRCECEVSKVYDIIKRLSDGTKLVGYYGILEEAKKLGLTEKEVDEAINLLKRRGDICDPRPGKYQII